MPLSNAREMEKICRCGKVFGALLTDLSKTFDCLDHELLIAKLNSYGFSLTALRLIHDYLSHRKQRTWFRVPQGWILGPLQFNIFLADLFLNTVILILQTFQMIIRLIFLLKM